MYWRSQVQGRREKRKLSESGFFIFVVFGCAANENDVGKRVSERVDKSVAGTRVADVASVALA